MTTPAPFQTAARTVQAVHHDGSEESAEHIAAWARPYVHGSIVAARNKETLLWIVVVETLFGAVPLDPDHWLVRTPHDDFAVLTPAAFAALFDATSDPDADE